ncbi:cytochrome P450 [Artomyces pyxidatus]|uniref:Cytochrome P450 n=1 Tax=Artomyces pyxidatus TaxID=48021 RepID=A0ACB8SQF5_9AGAM|nr:cytochrome P450 [Artomyces pyxidatus]
MPFFSTLSLVALALAVVFGVVVNRRHRRDSLPRPPGPKGLPVIGNLFDIPKTNSWLTYEEWARTYGDIMSVEVFGQVIVILQSPKAVRDLLEKRGTIYSDRPSLPFFEMAQWGWFLPTSRFDDQWRACRRLLDRSLRPSATVQYRPTIRAKTVKCLQRMLTQPNDYRAHIEQLQSAINMSVAYGYDVKENDDPFVETGREFVRMIQETALPGALLVNDLPFLRNLPDWFPGTGFKQLAKLSRKLGEEVVAGPLGFVKDAMANGTAQPSLALDDLRECTSEKGERDISLALGSLHAAGSDSMVAVLTSFLLILVLFPSVQEKAQAELDAVTGGTRLPEFADRPALPYVDALCKEVLRWRMISPLAFPHSATEDDVYEGYLIPKGSYILANSWSLLHDPATYPEPHAFKPERFLSPDGHVIDDPGLNAAFGFGKRICPGRHLVDSKLFIAVALVLSTFTVGKAKDAKGNEIPVPGTFSGPLVSQPDAFACSIVPRSQAAVELISAPVE